MKPCALCRCTGSTLPGGYSTVIIKPSLLPGMSFRSLDMSSVTFASGGADAGAAARAAANAAAPATRHRSTATIVLVLIAHLSFTWSNRPAHPLERPRATILGAARRIGNTKTGRATGRGNARMVAGRGDGDTRKIAAVQLGSYLHPC